MTITAVTKIFDAATDAELSKPDISILRQGRSLPPDFPLEIFRSDWSQWIEQVAIEAGAPVDYVAGPLLAAAATLIGNSRRVSPWQGWDEPAALWIANVGSPSSNKSPGADPVLKLLRTVEIDIAAGFDEIKLNYETAKESAAIAAKKWKMDLETAHQKNVPPPIMPENAMEPEEPVRPRIIANDTSTEKLGLLLSAHEKGLLFHRDELSGWLGAFDRYSGKGADRAFWVEAYGGRSYTIDRVKHKQPIEIPYLLVGIIGAIQPDPLTKLLYGADDGLVARFLWIWPDAIPPYRPKIKSDNTNALAAFRRLSSLAMDIIEDTAQQRIILLSDDAADLFQLWRSENHEISEHASGLLASAYGKAPGHLLRIALVLEFLWWAITPDAPEPITISKEAVAAAAHLLESYFKIMTMRVLADASVPEIERHAATLAKWIIKTKPDRINLRIIRREAGLPGLKKPEIVKAAADYLVQLDWLIKSEHSGPGRPKEDYLVNQRLWEVL